MQHQTESQPTLQELSRLVQEQQRQIAALQTPAPTKSRFGLDWLRRSSRAVLSMVWLPLVITGAAVASIPASTGVITGCYATKDGALRLIDAEAGQPCDNKEQPITWSQTGPQGAQGPAGPAGAQGVPGPVGPQGVQGLPGPAGAQGSPGPIGPQGVQGELGPIGPAGLTGATGLQGMQGEPGAVGATGATGAPGISGYEVVYTESAASDSPLARGVNSHCPVGKSVLGGGATIRTFAISPAPVVVVVSQPIGSAWTVTAAEIAPNDFNWQLTVYAICANVAP